MPIKSSLGQTVCACHMHGVPPSVTLSRGPLPRELRQRHTGFAPNRTSQFTPWLTPVLHSSFSDIIQNPCSQKFAQISTAETTKFTTFNSD
eukprot:6203537-Pleurochrysis_carterae.AAC.4